MTRLYLRLYWTLVASFCVLGVSIAFVQPLFSAPDEFRHWNVGHNRAERLLGADGCVPTFSPDWHRRRHYPLPPFEQLRKTPLTCMNQEDLYGDILTYPGVIASKLVLPRQQDSSIRQMQGIVVTRLLQGLMVVLCLLRVGMLVRCSQRTGAALLTAAFAMSPLLAQQAFSVTSDTVQLGFAMCLSSVILFWELLGPVDLALFALLGWGATAKPFVLTCVIPSVVTGYWYSELRANPTASVRHVLLGLLRALKPARRPSTQTWLLWLAVALTLVTVVLALYPSGASTRDETTAHAVSVDLPGVDRRAQLAVAMASPALLFQIAARQRPEPWLLSNYVGPLGWLDTHMSLAVVNTYLQLVGLGSLVELLFLAWRLRLAGPTKLSRIASGIRRAIPPLMVGLVGAVASVFFVAFVMYLVWTPVGAERPEGIQIRYYMGSAIVLIATICGAVGLVVEQSLRADDATLATSVAPSRSSRFPDVIRVLAVVGPALILALTLPYVARVLLDVEQRYQ